MGVKVTWDTYDSFPICVLGEKFRPEKKLPNGQNHPASIRALYKERIKRTQFKSLIWATYRKNFAKELLFEERSQKYLQQYLEKGQSQKKYITDMNWGCTLRVGQMLISNALLRHLLIDDKEFYYHSKE